MILRVKLAAKYKLDARLDGNRRVETDTITDAVYKIRLGGETVIEKSLSGGGLIIEHSDSAGDGFLTVIINNDELKYAGKMTHELFITDCQGNRYPTLLRPDFIFVEA